MYEIDGILYAENHNKMIKVVGVKVIENYQLLLTFSTGEKKVYNVKPLLELPAYKILKDNAVFCDVQIDFDTVAWCNGDIDIAPETLYEQSIAVPELTKA